MGYCTNYELEMTPELAEVCGAVEESEFSYAFYDTCKWYDHETDMRAFSRQYPDVIFKLTGAGEDPEDMWHKYFKDGKMQSCHAQITYDPFDESKLR